MMKHPISSFLQSIFLITVTLLNTCIDDYLSRVKGILDKGLFEFIWVLFSRNILPSDHSHYLQLTAYVNRFVFCFITSSSQDWPLLQSQQDEDMKVSLFPWCYCRFLLFLWYLILSLKASVRTVWPSVE